MTDSPPPNYPGAERELAPLACTILTRNYRIRDDEDE